MGLNEMFEIFKIFKSRKNSLTSPFEPELELKSPGDLQKYLIKISKFNRDTLCEEFSNVRAAKHNLMSFPVPPNEMPKTLALIRELNDKSVIICCYVFGQKLCSEYSKGNQERLIYLIDAADNIVSDSELEPVEHGYYLLKILGEKLEDNDI